LLKPKKPQLVLLSVPLPVPLLVLIITTQLLVQ
jgi:hypothetical protein